jgi:hypothetical protein
VTPSRNGRDLDVPVVLTPGQVHDICQAEGLISGFSCENVLADKGYDSDGFRAAVAERGAEVRSARNASWHSSASRRRMAGGKILPVAKDRPQVARHRSGRCRPADEIGVDARRADLPTPLL